MFKFTLHTLTVLVALAFGALIGYADATLAANPDGFRIESVLYPLVIVVPVIAVVVIFERISA